MQAKLLRVTILPPRQIRSGFFYSMWKKRAPPTLPSYSHSPMPEF